MHNDVDSPSSLISHSGQSLIEALLISGPQSRAELARRLSLSGASLTKITRPLIDDGYLVEPAYPVEAAAATGRPVGRPSQAIDVNPDFAHFIGIKLTGESLFAVLTDAKGKVLRETDAYLFDQGVEDVVELIGRSVETLRNGDSRVVGLGVSLSGNATHNDPTVRMSPFLHWSSVPLATMVSERVGLPTVLENDVRALTAAEHWFGEAAGIDSFAMLTFGAGIGCGIVSNGLQVEGRFGASGLIGHLPIDDRGPLCYAGHRGCAHAYATTTGITKTITAGLGVLTIDFEECLELARQGSPVAMAAFREAGRAIGQLIATVVNIVGPEKVFLTGEGVEMFTLGEDAARQRIGELLHWTATEPEIIVQSFGFTEWARGAVTVAIQQHIRQLASHSALAHRAPERTRTTLASVEDHKSS